MPGDRQNTLDTKRVRLVDLLVELRKVRHVSVSVNGIGARRMVASYAGSGVS